MKQYFMQILRPKTLQNLAVHFLPYTFWTACGLIFIAALTGIFVSPEDYQQGNLARIMYVHVPASWMALGLYTLMACLSLGGLVTRLPVFFLLSKSFALTGTIFTLISLVTGSIWGMPTWGTWWVWDARLTSMLILLFLYAGYLMMVSYGEKTYSSASIFLVIGWVNIPIIKWSVTWWYTLHQPASIMRLAKPAIHSSMLWPLFVMFFGFLLYSLYMSLSYFLTYLGGLKGRSKMLGEG